MEYTVQRGDTIAQVTKAMGSDWRTLKELNPQAVGRSRANGNWFVREGAVLTDQPKSGFAATLKEAEGQQPTAATAGTENKNSTSGELTHTLKAGETVWGLAVKKYHVDPEDILKLNNITDPRSLQIGRTLRIPAAKAAAQSTPTELTQTTQPTQSTPPIRTMEATLPLEKTEVVASWYGTYHHGRTMANGEPFNMYGPTIAHKDIPLGTKVLLENPETGERATATVTDRGPYIKGRDVDLSYKLAQRLSLDKQGVGSLLLTVL